MLELEKQVVFYIYLNFVILVDLLMLKVDNVASK